ncbi:3-hydroxyacyl-ACP dehydratase FabZ family protein [Actinokineospora sp.]|uniref:3-hydroxyacyl-ACP dehydratase FabZ family protein n=1 Tax=Actinokineospora sp. TaxID=1872133 RepID=UPI00403795B3
MIATLSDEIADLFRQAEKRPLVADRGTNPVLGRAEIERHLPQRDPFLFLDRVTLLDFDRHLVVARYDLTRAAEVFAGHFPGRPLFPGVLQIETIGQAGIVLGHAEGGSVVDFALTHVLAARFIRPVPPGGDIEVIAQSVEDGLFRTIVGQILRDGEVCAVAAVSGVDG